MSLRIHHIALRAPDPGATERFYASVLGLRVCARDEARGSVWLDADGTVLMIERADAGEPGVAEGSKELVAFGVEDKEAWRPRLPFVEAETKHTLYFRDPDGRR